MIVRGPPWPSKNKAWIQIMIIMSCYPQRRHHIILHILLYIKALNRFYSGFVFSLSSEREHQDLHCCAKHLLVLLLQVLIVHDKWWVYDDIISRWCSKISFCKPLIARMQIYSNFRSWQWNSLEIGTSQLTVSQNIGYPLYLEEQFYPVNNNNKAPFYSTSIHKLCDLVGGVCSWVIRIIRLRC